ncbi:signal peptide peptidase SppA [Pleionea litopenaei]|uniref:Signal peptide peptidase SppA n=1 Tax=Pleionea litopenaei TaxID=3070815 RepID=A0AA51X8E4_9GAMM|nr:signal peptide peptidase SppA [Pleionea sp. HL-JVS1]WMS88015.1 signal peptide peptidase SppA [Pleionea sp. HL-JVS1]
MEKPAGTAAKIFYYIWMVFKTNAIVVFGLIALFITIFGVIVPMFSGGERVKVPEGAALVFAPKGVITEQPQFVDPVTEALNEISNQQPPEESIYDLLDVLKEAKDDDRITTLAIYPGQISGVGPAMLEMLRDGIADFKESGKKVVAYGDFFSQSQYYIAAQADEVYMHPYGGVILEGYSRVRTYYASLLENLKVTPNVFKVGTYKSAIEPYLRDDMSDYAKDANRAFLGDIWELFKQDIAAARGIDAADIDRQINSYAEGMRQNNGDFAQLAISQKLVDKLVSRPEFREMMIERVGQNEKETSYKQINHRQYLKAIKPPIEFKNPNSDKVAVIVAKGAIMDGRQKEGTIGGDTLAYKIRRARLDDKVKAIVLRVDSPGGSAFASEVIRQELLKAKEKGLPLVVSMGTYAASGGYWISANADEIWARPSTLTGSIGIFGFIPTFERSLNWAGISRDGVGTTNLAGAMDVGRGLSPEVKEIIQANIENGYRRFLTLVSNGRNMTTEEVDAIAQGRIWSGIKAKELGLVDNLGSLNDAIKSAAKLANLEESKYDIWKVKRELTEKEQLLKDLFNATVAESPELIESFKSDTPVDALILDLKAEMEKVKVFNDPHHAYVHCNCEID